MNLDEADERAVKDYWRTQEFLDAWWSLNGESFDRHKYPRISRNRLDCSVYDCVYYIWYRDFITNKVFDLAEVDCGEVSRLLG